MIATESRPFPPCAVCVLNIVEITFHIQQSAAFRIRASQLCGSINNTAKNKTQSEWLSHTQTEAKQAERSECRMSEQWKISPCPQGFSMATVMVALMDEILAERVRTTSRRARYRCLAQVVSRHATKHIQIHIHTRTHRGRYFCPALPMCYQRFVSVLAPHNSCNVSTYVHIVVYTSPRCAFE